LSTSERNSRRPRAAYRHNTLKEDGGPGQRDPVDQRGRLGIGSLNVAGQKARGEGDEGDEHQEQDRDHQEEPVDVGDLVHDLVVVGADDADRDEADRVGGVAGPDAQELRTQSMGLVDSDVEDQERGGEGEDPVGEGLDPVLWHRP